MREAYGFDRPFLEQYLKQLGLILTGDFGDSLRFRTPSLPLVIERLPATLELALASIAVALLIAVPAGILSAVYQNTWLDFIVTTGSTLGRAMPNFWIGIMLILIVGVQLRWLPPLGQARGDLDHPAGHHAGHQHRHHPGQGAALEPARG